MNTLSIQLRYRPLRLGWCVLKDDVEAFRRALRLTFTLWGGSFNPVIPVDDPALAAALVKLFRVDALVPVSTGELVNAFLADHKHLPWPIMEGGLFIETMSHGRTSTMVDIRHPLAQLHESFFRNNPSPVPGLEIHRWEENDPLADVFLCSFGAYPAAQETGVDYTALAQQALIGVPHIIPLDGELAVPSIDKESVASLCRTHIRRHYAIRNHWYWPGFYVGRAGCFDDLVTFWNLRAADIALEFFDERYAARLNRPTQYWANHLRQMPSRPVGFQGIALWHRAEHPIDAARAFFGNEGLTMCRVSEGTWNGLNVRAPIVYFADAGVLAAVDESGNTPAISFSMVNRPFAEFPKVHHQHYVLSVEPGVGLFGNEQATLHWPFLPELNEYYGRQAYGLWNAIRSEPDAVGIVTSVLTEHARVRALSVTELITRVFEYAGIAAAPSKPGLVASTLIRQMGGLDGCRPFKIAGVRTLIEKHRPDEAFSRSTAMLTIKGQGADRLLSEYQGLYIAPRPQGVSLTNDAVLAYLLEKGVFRAGLTFHCPNCQLDFWRSLDEARSRLECDYCGHAFNTTPQLRDKDWAFRRSGLFGHDDHQQGAIPVLLTLQQLVHAPGTREAVFSTAMELKPQGANIRACETDFVVMVENRSEQHIDVVIGECKSRQPITSDDVAKLKAVADAFPRDRFTVYIVFAKLCDFSTEEIKAIKSVNGPHGLRAVLFSVNELEPYRPYDRLTETPEIQRGLSGFAEMAAVTARVFLGD